MAVGMAIAERHLNTAFGDDLVDHRTWVIAGDGLPDGGNQPRSGGTPPGIWGSGGSTCCGTTIASPSTAPPIFPPRRTSRRATAAYGWHTVRCDGLDADDVRRALDEALADPRPSLIACRTIIGFGAPPQARHRRHPRLRARRRGSRRRAQGARLDGAAVRNPRRHRRRLARAWPALEGGRGKPGTRGSRRARRRRRVPAPDRGAAARRLDPRRLSGRARRASAECRDPQILRARARVDQRLPARGRLAALPTSPVRTIPKQRAKRHSQKTIIPDVISITAFANSAWPRR